MVVPHGLDLVAGSTHAGGAMPSGNRVAVLVGLVGGVAVLPLVLHPSSNLRSATRFFLATAFLSDVDVGIRTTVIAVCCSKVRGLMGIYTITTGDWVQVFFFKS